MKVSVSSIRPLGSDMSHEITAISIVQISERCVTDDVFTSIHIEEYSIMARDTKLGPEEITKS